MAGLMVYGTRPVPFPGAPCRDYPRSCWVDVSGTSEGKWVPTQGDVLLKILRRMCGEFGISLEHIYVLSPFRDVVSGCKGFVGPELRQDGVPEAKVEGLHRRPHRHCAQHARQGGGGCRARGRHRPEPGEDRRETGRLVR